MIPQRTSDGISQKLLNCWAALLHMCALWQKGEPAHHPEKDSSDGYEMMIGPVVYTAAIKVQQRLVSNIICIIHIPEPSYRFII
jgi:hypothetical protein